MFIICYKFREDNDDDGDDDDDKEMKVKALIKVLQ